MNAESVLTDPAICQIGWLFRVQILPTTGSDCLTRCEGAAREALALDGAYTTWVDLLGYSGKELAFWVAMRIRCQLPIRSCRSAFVCVDIFCHFWIATKLHDDIFSWNLFMRVRHRRSSVGLWSWLVFSCYISAKEKGLEGCC